MLAFIADQLRIDSNDFGDYAQRGETRREHLRELQAYLGVEPFGRQDYRTMARIAFNESIRTDRGEAIVGAMVVHLRQNSILLPSAAVLEKIALVARARARKQAYKELTAGIDHTVRDKLDALICVADDEARTPLAWLREWPEAPVQKNLAGIVERLQSVRVIGVEPDRERRIHRARYAAIARETAILSAQHLHRFDYQRQLATLVVFAREMEAELTDAALTMFDKMMGGVFCKADRQHKDNLVNRAKILDGSARALLGMAKAMLSARANGTDPLAAVERTIGWQRLEEMVEAMDQNLGDTRADNLAEVIESYPRVHRTATIILGAFTFRSWKSTDSLLTALEVLRQLYASGERKLPAGVPTAFLAPVWRKLIGPGPVIDRRTWEVAVVMALRDRLRAGDIWVEGSRAFRAFDDFLLPPAAFAAKRKADELGLAVPDRFETWRDERLETLERRLREVATLASAGKLPEALITEAGLSINPIRQNDTDVDDIARRLYGMLPRLRITELLAEVHIWTGFAERFVHLRTGEAPEDPIALMTVLADATNLGLARMAWSSGVFSHSQLLWTAEWHLRDETYQAALACLVDEIHAQPFTALWGDGETSSSDGQFFRAGGRGEAAPITTPTTGQSQA
jgi:Tn3 transposase DDE domain/Domain of unknown function (DUF4158)